MELSAHAYITEGGEATLDAVLELLKKKGIKVKGNPDVYVRAYPAFSMDDARALREKAALRALGGGKRFFIVLAPTIPPDAQNALLKTLEEPPAGAVFVFIVPSAEILLPTFRSRTQKLELKKIWTSDVHMDIRRPYLTEGIVDVKKFLAALPAERLEMLKPLLEKDDDDNRNMFGTLAFLSAVEIQLSSKIASHQEGIHAIYRARKYITDRGSLMKPLLEQAALLIPRA